MKIHLKSHVKTLAALAAFMILSACATGPEVVNHSFGFDMFTDGQDAILLDYRYGDSRHPGASNPEDKRKEGRSDQQSIVNGEMRRGDSLYVKWRNKNSSQSYEDTVDLRSRLPADITKCRISFLIHGPQLYVYLVTPLKRPKNEPPNGPQASAYLKTLTIYPDREAL